VGRKPCSSARRAWKIGLLLSTVLMACVFVFASVFYTVNDDSQILREYMGFQPGGAADFNLFVQAPVSTLLYALSVAFPRVAWFTILQIFLLWFADAVIFKSILQCFDRRGLSLWGGVAASLVFFLQFCLYATARMTFTVTSGLLAAAAVAQMMSMDVSNLSPRGYVARSLFAAALLLVANGLRDLMGLPAFGFFCIAAAYHALMMLKTGKPVLRVLRPVGITLLIAAVLLGGQYGLRKWEISAKG